jgi:hypothetical protein
LKFHMKSTPLAAALFAIFAGSAGAQIGNDGFEFQVNTETVDEQQRPQIVRLTGGKFLIAWDSEHRVEQGDGRDVYARLYHADNSGPVAAEFRLNAHLERDQENVALAALPGGGFVAAWESFRQISTGSNDDVFARLFDADGVAVSDEFLVNQELESNQTFPSIAVRHDGSFVIVWTSNLQDGDREGVFARRFASDGSAIGDEFQVNTLTTRSQSTGRAGADSVVWYNQDEFVVVWQSEEFDGAEHGIAARRFQHDGTPLDNEEFRVNEITEGNQASPAVTSIGDDVFIVTWNDRRFNGITFLRGYQGNGSPLSAPIEVGAAATVSQPAIAMENEGATFGVVWTQVDGNSAGIRGRRFDDQGRPISASVIVNTFQTGVQQNPHLIAGPGNQFVIVWESVGQDGDGRGIFGQRLSGQGLCGDAVSDEVILASDALAILRGAVGTIPCSPCICDVNGSGVTAGDALAVLKRAVGGDIALVCPAC